MAALETITGYALTFLGLEETDARLTLAVETTLDKVLCDIRQPCLPLGLYRTVAEMSADAYRMAKEANGEDAGRVTGCVSGVSDNGQTVSYRESPQAAALASACERVLLNYEGMLAGYRKAGW